MLFVTGGSGFVGSNFIIDYLALGKDEHLLNIDKLTYAGNPHNLKELAADSRYLFSRTDICDGPAVAALFDQYRPQAILHCAAESHVDRSISSPDAFIKTNVHGTFTLLEAARRYWDTLQDEERNNFRFVHVSTDEVYGSLALDDDAFTEHSPYAPNNPYSASKAASDHLVRAFHHTYGLPVLTTHCSNNYGPFHFPEKLIPLIISYALEGKPLPLYGDGLQIRDWLYVADHCSALRAVLEKGRPGEIYNIGSKNEQTNLAVVHALCDMLDSLRPKATGSYRDQIVFTTDRPGHDRRYAIDARKIETELGWYPAETFASGIAKTVTWYLDHEEWAAQACMNAAQYRV